MKEETPLLTGPRDESRENLTDEAQEHNLNQEPEEQPQEEAGGFKESGQSFFDMLNQEPPPSNEPPPGAGDFTEFQEMEDEPEPEEEGGETDSESAQRIARMFAMIANLGNANICAIIADENPELFKLPPHVEKEYAAICAAYFQESGFTPSPAQMFFGGTAILFSNSWYKAYKIYNEKAKAAEQQAKTGKQAGKQQRQQPPRQQHPAPQEPAPIIPQGNGRKIRRTRFNIDNEGRYIYAAPGSGKARKLKQAERTESANPEIIAVLRQGWKNEDIKQAIESGALPYLEPETPLI